MNNGIDWRSYVEVPDRTTPARLLAYVNLQSKSEQAQVKGSDARRIVASLLDLSQINDFERIMDWMVYDRFTLIAPAGEVLIGIQRPESHLHEGVNLKPEGLVFKLVNHDGPGWAAIYTISFKSFFRYAFWSLTTLLLSLLAIIGLGWLASRWYKKQVILPARQAHASIAESEAFSRVVIDTAPTGLCVVRCADQQILLENQRARQWQGTSALVKALNLQQDNAIPQSTIWKSTAVTCKSASSLPVIRARTCGCMPSTTSHGMSKMPMPWNTPGAPPMPPTKPRPCSWPP